MTFAGVNYLAIFTAAIVAWLAGAVWYMALGKVWMAALGTNPEKMQQMKKEPGAFLPFIYAFLADLVIAWVLGVSSATSAPGRSRSETASSPARFAGSDSC